jgi:PAS domain S-box-containing protein
MKLPSLPAQEEYRLSTLHALGLLDTPPDERFDAITRTAAALFDTPISMVSLVDANRQWFKSRVGLDVRETSRDISFCGHAILRNEVFVVEDALQDARFNDNPLVIGAPYVRFYAGKPLAAPNGQRIGTLCVIDRRSRTFTAAQRDVLDQLGRWAEAEISLIAERLALPRYLGHLLGLLEEPVVLADVNGRVQFANAAVSRLLGYEPEELKGLPLTALMHQSEREKIVAELAALERVPSDFASLEHSAAVLCKNGTRLAVMLTLSRRIAVTQSVTTMILRQQ